jgi:hypothetical protein
MYTKKRAYTSKMYSNFIFNYMKTERDIRENERIKKQYSKPEYSPFFPDIPSEPVWLNSRKFKYSHDAHELSSLVRKPGSCVRIPLRVWMFGVCMCVRACVYLCLFIGRGLATS